MSKDRNIFLIVFCNNNGLTEVLLSYEEKGKKHYIDLDDDIIFPYYEIRDLFSDFIELSLEDEEEDYFIIEVNGSISIEKIEDTLRAFKNIINNYAKSYFKVSFDLFDDELKLKKERIFFITKVKEIVDKFMEEISE